MGSRHPLIALGLLWSLAAFSPPRIPAQPQPLLEAQEIEAQEVLEGPLGHQPPPPLDDSRITRGDGAPALTDKQKKSLLQANLAKSKKDSEELADLARELQEELNKPNATSLSSDGVYRLEKIERLAKKIRDEMKEY